MHCWNVPFGIGIHSKINVAMLHIILMGMSHFMFLINDLLVAIYVYFRLGK